MSMYDKSAFFQTYFSNASEKPLLVESLDKRFNPSTELIRILDLGCHDGALMKKIINAYSHRMPENIILTGVEPSLPALELFAYSNFSIPVKMNTFAGTAENYFKFNTDYFDWIFASQCLYWSLDLDQIIRQIAQAGKSALIVLRGKHGIYEIQSRFKQHIGNPMEQFYTAEDIASSLATQKIPFQQEMIKSLIKLPPGDSQEFKWLMSFFLQIDEEHLTQDTFKEVQSWITSRYSGQMPHEVCFFWLGDAMIKSN